MVQWVNTLVRNFIWILLQNPTAHTLQVTLRIAKLVALPGNFLATKLHHPTTYSCPSSSSQQYTLVDTTQAIEVT